MTNKVQNWGPWVIGLAIGGCLLYFFSNRAEASPPELWLPDIHDIATAENLTELDTYYEVVNELYVRGDIDESTYNSYYEIYQSRYNELLEQE